jgi:hypothetical protein
VWDTRPQGTSSLLGGHGGRPAAQAHRGELHWMGSTDRLRAFACCEPCVLSGWRMPCVRVCVLAYDAPGLAYAVVWHVASSALVYAAAACRLHGAVPYLHSMLRACCRMSSAVRCSMRSQYNAVR